MVYNGTDNSKQNSPKDQINYYGIVASLIYIIIILAFGLPIWWTTTSPLRHSLPDISSLLVHSQRIVHSFPVNIIVLDDSIERDELRSQLSQNYKNRITSEITYEYDWYIRPSKQKEEEIFNKKSTSLEEIDQLLNSVDGNNVKGKIWIYILAEGSSLIKGNEQYLIGKNRFAYIKNDGQIRKDKSLVELIMEIVETTESTSLNALKSKMTNYLLEPEIDLIINIINEDEEKSIRDKIEQIHLISEEAMGSRSGINQLVKVNVISQVLHYVVDEKFINNQLISKSDQPNVRLFNISHVPELLNVFESRIVEHNNKQSFHIFIYIPSSAKSLFFYDSKTDIKSNFIMTPYRGGILSWNQPNDFVNGFRQFVRNIIAFPQSTDKNIYLHNNIFFSKWELDGIIRAVNQLQLSKTLSSLESISKLILKVRNIVILEEIAKRMHDAVDLSHQSIDLLAQSNLSEAFRLSSRAYISSETAFFDPSLLELLYFPQDQKYAVYFPLFLPVSLPLIASFYHLFKTFKSKKLKSD